MNNLDLMFYGSLAGGVCGVIAVIILVSLVKNMDTGFTEMKKKQEELMALASRITIIDNAIQEMKKKG